MNDLVERARKYAWQFRRCNTDTGPIIEQLCDEVERLRRIERAVKAYIDAPGQVRGELYRELLVVIGRADD